ncbi:MAG: tripartite tricarboxylate transporter TctB family protein [Desulfomonile tiedjei]|nr:tripartite tricarboxylate transporter TctB family protein [Desulfomonile tiedjei]
MAVRVRNQKDFWAGILYAGFGAAGLAIARHYSPGTSARMGAGYFPTLLSGLLMVFGMIALARSFLRDGEPIGKLAWKQCLIVCGAVVVFGLLLKGAGLPVSLAALILLSGLGSGKSRIDLRTVAVMLGLIVFCVLVFIKALGVPIPLLGSWLGR